MFANRTPSFAIRSMFGVLNTECPAQLIAFQRRSSQRMNRMLGCTAVAARVVRWPASVRSNPAITSWRIAFIWRGVPRLELPGNTEYGGQWLSARYDWHGRHLAKGRSLM